MNKSLGWILAAVAFGAVLAAGGYWFGRQVGPAPVPTAAAPGGDPGQARRVLYYRNPMGLPDTSPVPKKDPMGMDYIPVYAEDASGQDDEPGTVRIATDKVQKLGVRVEAVAERTLVRRVRAAGTVQVDERRQAVVAPRFEGWIQVLHVNATGQAVARGQPLAEVYSPELASAQREYQIARAGQQAMTKATAEAVQGLGSLAESALARLTNWEVSPDEIRRLEQGGEPRRVVTLLSPAGGVVTEKSAVQGMRFMPGEVLFRIADLSSVWLVAEVYEQDLAAVRVGQQAMARFDAYPDRQFEGRVSFIYPMITPETRTARVRVDLANPGGVLKPAMYGTVEVAAGEGSRVLAIPDSALIESGTRRVALVQRGEGRFEPREVKTGLRADGWVEVLDGVKAGEQVVVRANFLIDAESNLRAALGGFGHTGHGGGAAPGTGDAAGAGARREPPGETVALHAGEGTLTAIDSRAGTVSLAHGPIPSLQWSAMTMDFRVAEPALLTGLRKGQKVRFELRQGRPGEFVIVAIRPEPAPADAHKSH